jgi:hypothetical protein
MEYYGSAGRELGRMACPEEERAVMIIFEIEAIHNGAEETDVTTY